MQAVLGLLSLTLIAWLLGKNYRTFNWRLVAACLAAQFVFASLFLHVPLFIEGLRYLNHFTRALGEATMAGTTTIFGYIGGAPAPFEVREGAQVQPILAFQVLPQILILSVIFAILWHVGIMKPIIRGMARVFQYSIGIDGPLGLAASASVFLGMVEAPMLIKPYIRQLSRSDLFALLTCGMSTVAGTVMILYATLLTGVIETPLVHILIASVISIPAAIMIARLMVPKQATIEKVELVQITPYRSLMDAITRSSEDGLKILLNVIAMLIVLVALVALTNQVLGLLPQVGNNDLTLERLLGWCYAPIAWLIGIPWDQAFVAGRLLGEKTILSEFLAYISLSELPETTLSAHSKLIMTYSLSGFANFASLGIMLGGFAAMCPERQSEIIKLAPQSLISGTLATCMTGAVVGLIS